MRSPFGKSSPEHSALSHVSISSGFLTSLSRYFVLESDLFLCGSGLDFFCLVLLTSSAPTQRSPRRGRSRSRTVTHVDIFIEFFFMYVQIL